jgi:hypothetical protein
MHRNLASVGQEIKKYQRDEETKAAASRLMKDRVKNWLATQ